jgi:hypothetical protein
MSQGAQNKKMGPDANGTAENEFGCAKNENGPDSIETVENEFGARKT